MSETAPAPWRERTAALALVGVAVASVARVIATHARTDDVVGPAVATFLVVGASVLALVVTRQRPSRALAFAIAAGVVVASVIVLSGSPLGIGGDVWRLASALFAAAIAAPLFQARWLDTRAFGFAVVRDYTYANLIRFAAAWAFTAIAWALAWLLAGLFKLIGIGALDALLTQKWFTVALVGGVNGAALGIMRDRDASIGGLGDSAADALTPVFAFGIAVFLLAIPVTGLAPLWAATKSTTPILLVTIAAAVRMIDSVAGGHSESESRNRIVRVAGQVLAAAVLPIAAIAWVSVRARVDQYGYSPDRLWALTLAGIACAAGAVYWWALAQRRDVLSAARRAHLWLMIGLTALAVLLSTPIVGFGTISAHDQEARLLDGKVAPAKFDWRALHDDFGPAGRATVERLKRSPNVEIAKRARTAGQAARGMEGELVPLAVVPAGSTAPPELEAVVRQTLSCQPRHDCTLLYRSGENRAVGVSLDCDACPVRTHRFVRLSDRWTAEGDGSGLTGQGTRLRSALRAGQVEVRPVRREQVFVGGEPVGDVLPETSPPVDNASPPAP